MATTNMLRCVTLTGADDRTDPKALIGVSHAFPFVEWGILFGKQIPGEQVPRYPSMDWVLNFMALAHGKVNLSFHLCGSDLRAMLEGKLSPTLASLIPLVGRVQLNCSRLLKTDPTILYGRPFAADYPKQQFIAQLGDSRPNLEPYNFVPFFDASGGKGVLPMSWPDPYDVYTGYAGGLTPENVAQELNYIQALLPNRHPGIWIDMETGVRDRDNVFDVNRCLKVLMETREYVLDC